MWGCPYHGLVVDGLLTLPNGKTLPHRQLEVGANQDQRGATTLIKHPNAQPIERTEEEAAEDAKRGWQWWDRAIIGGGLLHGVPLYGWIYIDPAGECWQVGLTLTGDEPSVELTRFGLLAGKSVKHRYPLEVPDFGQASPVLTQPPGSSQGLGRTIYHASPTGDRAAIELSMDFRGNETNSQPWPYRPVGWLEVTLKGLASKLEAAVSVLYTRAQTIGTAFDQPATVTPGDWWLESSADGRSRTLRTGKRPPDSYLIDHEIQKGTASKGYTGWILGIHYDAEGTRHVWQLNERTDTNLDIPALEYDGPYDFEGNDLPVGPWILKTKVTDSHTFELLYDGEPVLTRSVSLVEQFEESITLDPSLDTRGTYLSTLKGSATYSTGEAQTFDQSGEVQKVLPLRMGGRAGFAPGAPSRSEDIPYSLGRSSGSWRVNGQQVSIRHLVQRLSNQVFGVAFAAEQRTTWAGEVATPGGVIDVEPLALERAYTDGGGTLYASWCPVTDNVARGLRPMVFI